MTTVQTLTGPFNIPDPTWPTYDLWPRQGTFTSDTFSAAGEAAGAITDVDLGGRPATWQGDTGGWRKRAGRLENMTTSPVAIAALGINYAAECTVTRLPLTGDLMTLSVRRSQINYSSDMTGIELRVGAGGTLTLVDRGASAVTLGTASGALSPGGHVRLEVDGTAVRVYLNGALILSGTATVTGKGYAALSTDDHQNGTGATVDNFKIDSL